MKLAFIGLMMMFLAASCCPRTAVTRDTHDSVVVQVKERSFSVQDSLKIFIKNDSLIQTKSFEGILEKILERDGRRDTILINYKFPENRISVEYKTLPDTTRHETRTEKTSETKLIERPWHEPFVYVGIGVIGALILAAIIFLIIKFKII